MSGAEDSDDDFQPISFKKSAPGIPKQDKRKLAQEKRKKEKEDEKVRKDQQKLLQSQESGKFKREEIGLIMEESIYLENIGAVIQPEYSVFSQPFPISGLCLWSHRKKMDGGSINPFSDSLDLLAYNSLTMFAQAVVIMQSSQFVDLISCDISDFNPFISLRTHINAIKEKLSKLTSSESKLIVAMSEVNKQVASKHKKKISALCDEAIAFLIYEMDVEVIAVKSVEDISEYLKTVTRLLAESKYANTETEFTCVTKKSKKAPLPLSESEKDLYELQKTWRDVLGQVPAISDVRAHSFSKAYSCPQKLRQAVTNPLRTTTEKREMFRFDFSDSGFDGGKAKTSNNKLSRVVYQMMTSKDASELLDEIN